MLAAVRLLPSGSLPPRQRRRATLVFISSNRRSKLQKIKEEGDHSRIDQIGEHGTNDADNRLSDIERFIRLSGVSEAYEHWNYLHAVVKKAAQALADWAHSKASIFSHDVERIIGQGIIAQCHLNDLNPHVESDRQKAANCIVDMADSIVGNIGRLQWEIAVTRIGQLASEMRLSTGGQSIGGSNGNADELTNWNGTKKQALGRS